MPTTYCDLFRKLLRPLEPIATGERAVLRRLDGIRAVLFDLYGTLFISASGEVGTAGQQSAEQVAAPERAMAEALAAVDVATQGPADQGVELFFEAIEASHAESRRAGVDFPEVDIVEIWRIVLAEMSQRGLVDAAVCQAVDLRRLAVEYEARANPCWPMPGLPECLNRLRQAGLTLGIVSNAQFFSAGLFEALLGEPAESWGFDGQLQYFSYQHGYAKPGLRLYELAAEDLRTRGIGPGEVVYVGNDVLNDIWPANVVKFSTGLFAGDARSLRRREGDPRVAGVSPDLVLTDLGQLADCLI